MDSNQVINDVCNCLKLLCSHDKSDITPCVKSRATKLEKALYSSIENVKYKINSIAYLHSKISTFLNFTSGDDDSVEWTFVEYCLSLLILLKNILHDLANNPVEGKSLDTQRTICGNALSIEQEKIVIKSLEFIIGLGIIPNLIPGVRFLLRWKSHFTDLVENIKKDTDPWKKHHCLVASVICLLICTKESSLGSLILSHHLEVLLAALIQLCYAPIKKLNADEKCYSDVSYESNTANKVMPNEELCCIEKSDVCSLNLSKTLQRIHSLAGSSDASEQHLITQMKKDRMYFTSEFRNLLHHIYKPLIIRELILLLGAHSQTCKQKERPPLWLRKTCSQLLTDCLLQPDGVLAVVQGVLELCIGPDTSLGKNDISTSDWIKCDMVARLIAHIPAKLPSAELYYKQIWPQILNLIYKNDAIVGNSYLRVACCILSHMLEQHPSTTKVIVFGHLLKPLLNCLQQSNRPCGDEEHFIIAKEEELTKCINDLHKIFLFGADPNSVLHEELLAVYLPLFHLLSSMQGEMSQLRNKLQDLLVTLHKKCDVATTLNLLNMASFEDSHLTGIYCLANSIHFLPGSNGGMVIWHLPIKSDEWLMKIESKCHAVSSILENLNNNTVTGAFVISLLKRLTSSLSAIEKDSIQSDTYLESKLEVHVNHLQKHLLILKFMDYFSEHMENILIQNKKEAISFVQESLNHRIQMYKRKKCEPEMLEDETLIIALKALEILANQKDQLVSSDWDALKCCLPNLDNLISFHPKTHIKTLANSLKIVIATHCALGVKDVRDFNNECKINMSKPEEVKIHNNTDNLDDIVKKCLVLKEKDVQKIGKNSPQNNENVKYIEKALSSTEELNLFMCNDDDHVDVSNLDLTNKINYDSLTYQTVLQNLQDPLLPVRGHALMALNHLILKNDHETLSHKESVLKILQENLLDSDTYIYLPAIQGLVDFANICTDYVLPILVNSFILPPKYSSDVRVKFGEILLKISKNLGSMIPKYRDLLINAFLMCTKDPCPQIRASSLSNLAEVCKQLKCGMEPFLQEILLCASSLVKSDHCIEVRRASVLLITLLLQGVGNDAFKLLESQMRDLYHLLKLVYSTEKDDVILLHVQLALEEISTIVQNFMTPHQDFTKKINILHPLQ